MWRSRVAIPDDEKRWKISCGAINDTNNVLIKVVELNRSHPMVKNCSVVDTQSGFYTNSD